MKGIVPKITKESSPQGRLVYIIRHGQTLLNKEDRIRAWLNIPLDETGHEQALELGETMRQEEVELDGLFTSDLLRSVQTSIEISKMTSIPILGTTKALRPWDVGIYSGKDGKMVHGMMMELARKKPDEELGGGESFNQFKFRILIGIISLLNDNRGLKLGFVSHSRGERILHAWVANDCDPDLEVDLDVFGERGEDTATSQELLINSELVLT